LVGYIQKAVTEGSRIEPACGEADISLRTYRRWAKGGNIVADKRPDAVRAAPANKLSKDERDTFVKAVNQSEYVSPPPSQIVPRLADQGSTWRVSRVFIGCCMSMHKFSIEVRRSSIKTRSTG
jgi:putative transposase